MAIFRVSTQKQFNSALNSVSGGDTILLSSGTYGNLSLNEKFSKKVTIASADPDKPAVVTSMMLRGAANVEVKDLKFDYIPGKTGDSPGDSPFWIENSRGISVNNVQIEGQKSGLYGIGIGLRVKNCQDVQVVDSEVSNFRNGLSFTGSENVKVLNNDFRGMSNDSILNAGMRNMLIEGNDFRDMKSPPALKHKDMIQFFTGQGSLASHDITIRDNVIVNTERSHGIFFTNTMVKEGDLSVRYTNILIEGNDIRSAQTHGITVSHADGVTIRNNSVLQHQDVHTNEPVTIPRIHVSYLSTDVVITGNKVASVPNEMNASWDVSKNQVGPIKYQQWMGDYGKLTDKAAVAIKTSEVDQAKTAANENDADGHTVGAESGTPTTVRINAAKLDEDATLFVDGLDFLQGDVMVFRNFDNGTFRNSADGNAMPVWDNGGAVKVNSLADFLELDALSNKIDVTVKGDMLFLKIEQNGETFDFAIDGFDAMANAPAQDHLL